MQPSSVKKLTQLLTVIVSSWPSTEEESYRRLSTLPVLNKPRLSSTFLSEVGERSYKGYHIYGTHTYHHTTHTKATHTGKPVTHPSSSTILSSDYHYKRSTCVRHIVSCDDTILVVAGTTWLQCVRVGCGTLFGSCWRTLMTKKGVPSPTETYEISFTSVNFSLQNR